MSTNSTLIMKTETGFESIYVHWDGYKEYMLSDEALYNYDTIELVKELFALGDLSSVKDTVKASVAYCRDRGESFNKAIHNNINLEDVIEIVADDLMEFIYYFNENTNTWDCVKS